VEKGGLADGTVMTAHRQTGGKGRRGRSWDDGDGENIAFSILLTPDMDPGRASMLTIVAAMAVADAINGVLAREKEDLRCGIKWPNDIIMDRKKVCGILTEMSAEPDHIDYVIIGIGINVNASSFPEELRDRATSILLQSGVRTDRSALISAVLNRFELRYGRFLETLDLSGLKEEYEGRLTGLGKKVRVLDPCGEFEGICRGIDEAGALLVETPENGLRRITSGEVSVRGIYGYV
jgi:BirA family biotin operon repressor/biotin-[acetyl-CoA-carboxylase] ligase